MVIEPNSKKIQAPKHDGVHFQTNASTPATRHKSLCSRVVSLELKRFIHAATFSKLDLHFLDFKIIYLLREVETESILFAWENDRKHEK